MCEIKATSGPEALIEGACWWSDYDEAEGWAAKFAQLPGWRVIPYCGGYGIESMAFSGDMLGLDGDPLPWDGE